VLRIIKMVIFFILIFVYTESNGQEYVYIGKDSIKIINPMMSYHLSFIKDSFALEPITFRIYNDGSFKQIYDSLSRIYLIFDYTISGLNPKEDSSGLNLSYYFLVDSNVIYNLWIFIPDKIHRFGDLCRRNFLKKLFSLKEFGLIAFKDSEHINFLNEEYKTNPKDEFLKNDEFFKEYKKLLIKLNKKKKEQK